MYDFDFKKNQDIFAARLNALIKSEGMKPKDFSIKAEIPDPTIYRYLHSSRVPKVDNIIRISDYFGVSMDWLFGRSEDRNERWSEEVLAVAQRYSIASPDDRRVIDAVLEKYKDVKL